MRRTILSPAEVADIGLKALFAGKSSVIAGRLNRAMEFVGRFLSRHSQAKTIYRMSKS
jgi:uncharacterized protein